MNTFIYIILSLCACGLIACLIILLVFAIKYSNGGIIYETHKTMSEKFAKEHNKPLRYINFDYFTKFFDRDYVEWYTLNEHENSFFRVPTLSELRRGVDVDRKDYIHAEIWIFNGECYRAENRREYNKIKKYIRDSYNFHPNIRRYENHHEMWENLYTPLYKQIMNEILS